MSEITKNVPHAEIEEEISEQELDLIAGGANMPSVSELPIALSGQSTPASTLPSSTLGGIPVPSSLGLTPPPTAPTSTPTAAQEAMPLIY